MASIHLGLSRALFSIRPTYIPRILPFYQLQDILIRPISIALPWSISDIWESILKAVPKKKSSYSKKRSRQMAGKALKDVTALNTCSSCGQTKRAHVVCPSCLAGV